MMTCKTLKTAQLFVYFLLIQATIVCALETGAQLRGSEMTPERSLIVSDILRASADFIDGIISAIFGFIRDLFNL